MQEVTVRIELAPAIIEEHHGLERVRPYRLVVAEYVWAAPKLHPPQRKGSAGGELRSDGPNKTTEDPGRGDLIGVDPEMEVVPVEISGAIKQKSPTEIWARHGRHRIVNQIDLGVAPRHRPRVVGGILICEDNMVAELLKAGESSR